MELGWKGSRNSELGLFPYPVLNSSSQEEISIWDMLILPNFQRQLSAWHA